MIKSFSGNLSPKKNWNKNFKKKTDSFKVLPILVTDALFSEKYNHVLQLKNLINFKIFYLFI
jgi:hypothetical protein